MRPPERRFSGCCHKLSITYAASNSTPLQKHKVENLILWHIIDTQSDFVTVVFHCRLVSTVLLAFFLLLDHIHLYGTGTYELSQAEKRQQKG
jgi:hypothetical protein